MELATPLIPTNAIAALPGSRSPHIIGYNNDDNYDMCSHSPRVNDNLNFEFDDLPSFPLPLLPPIGYLMRREGGDSASITGHLSSTFPNLSLSVFPMPPTSPFATGLPPFWPVTALPPSLSRATSRGWDPVSWQRESGQREDDLGLNGEGEHGRGEGGERMERELDVVQDMLGEAGIALSKVRVGLEE